MRLLPSCRVSGLYLADRDVKQSPATWGYYLADEQAPADASAVGAASGSAGAVKSTAGKGTAAVDALIRLRKLA